MQPLRPGKLAPQPGIYPEQQVERPPRPLQLLGIKCCQRSWYQATAEHLGNIHRLPARRVQAHGRVHIFGEAGGVAPNRIEGSPTKRAVGPNGLHRSVSIHTHHQGAVEMVGLLCGSTSHEAFFLIAIGLHHLHEAHPVICKIRQHMVQEIWGQYMVGVQYNAKVAGGLAQGVVNITSFGVAFIGSGNVHYAQLFAHLPQVRVVAFVAQVASMRIMHGLHGL